MVGGGCVKRKCAWILYVMIATYHVEQYRCVMEVNWRCYRSFITLRLQRQCLIVFGLNPLSHRSDTGIAGKIPTAITTVSNVKSTNLWEVDSDVVDKSQTNLLQQDSTIGKQLQLLNVRIQRGDLILVRKLKLIWEEDVQLFDDLSIHNTLQVTWTPTNKEAD